MSVRSVLVYRPGSLGDTIVAIPALYAVRARFGREARITLLRDHNERKEVVPENVLRGHSSVDDFLSYPAGVRGRKKAAALWRLFKKVRALSFDAAVYLGPGQRSAFAVRRDDCFFRLAGIPRRYGFTAFSRGELVPRGPGGAPALVPQECEFLLKRLKAAGFAVPPDCGRPDLELTEPERRSVDAWIHSQGAAGRPLVAVAPGVNQPANQWPLERFAELGRRLKDELRCDFVVIGGSREKAAADYLLKEWGGGHSSAGVFAPRLTAALIERCRLFVGLDSGPIHLASCTETPIVAVYSDRDNPGRWHPLSGRATILRRSVACGGCRKSVCRVPGHPCMIDVGVEEVFEAAVAAWGRAS